MTSHAACSSALKPLEILMRAVVTIVVSKAEMNRQNHRPAMMVCSRAELIFGTPEGITAGVFAEFADIFTKTEDARLARCDNAEDESKPWKLIEHIFLTTTGHAALVASVAVCVEALGPTVDVQAVIRKDGTMSGPHLPDHATYVR